MSGKSPMKLEVTSRHDDICLLGCKAHNKLTSSPFIKKIAFGLRRAVFRFYSLFCHRAFHTFAFIELLVVFICNNSKHFRLAS